MTSTVPFGRRASAALQPGAPPAAALSPEAEAFRRELAASGRPSSEFARWRSETRLARWAAWAASLGLMVSGAAAYAAHAPAAVSGLLEVGGWGLGAWLRRARRARLQAVRAWEPDAPA